MMNFNARLNDMILNGWKPTITECLDTYNKRSRGGKLLHACLLQLLKVILLL